MRKLYLIFFIFIIVKSGFTSAQEQVFDYTYTPKYRASDFTVLNEDDLLNLQSSLSDITSDKKHNFHTIFGYFSDSSYEHLFFWKCFSKGQGSKLSTNGECSPLVYSKDKNGDIKFYFDEQWRYDNFGSYDDQDIEVKNLAFINLKSLEQTELLIKKAHEQQKTAIFALSLPFIIAGGWYVGAYYIVPLVESGAIALFARGVVSGYIAPQIGGYILAQAHNAQKVVFGFGLLADIVLTGAAEEVVMNQVYKTTNIAIDQQDQLVEGQKLISYLPIKSKTSEYEDNLIKMLNANSTKLVSYKMKILQNKPDCPNCFYLNSYMENELMSPTQIKMCRAQAEERKNIVINEQIQRRQINRNLASGSELPNNFGSSSEINFSSCQKPDQSVELQISGKISQSNLSKNSTWRYTDAVDKLILTVSMENNGDYIPILNTEVDNIEYSDLKNFRFNKKLFVMEKDKEYKISLRKISQTSGEWYGDIVFEGAFLLNQENPRSSINIQLAVYQDGIR